MKTYKEALIIDDDVDLCMTLRTVLRSSITTIKTANTLGEGKKQLLDSKPEIVFLDNNLPDGEGVTIIKEIKEHSPDSAIIFITAVDSAKAKALEAGVDIYLEKPLTFTAIMSALGGLANKTPVQ